MDTTAKIAAARGTKIMKASGLDTSSMQPKGYSAKANLDYKMGGGQNNLGHSISGSSTPKGK
jgi:hypothetical protein